MSFERDKVMFSAQDNYRAGVSYGYEQATHLFGRRVGNLLGVEPSLITDTNFSDVNARLVVLTAIASTVEARLAEERTKHSMLVSPDPVETAKALVEKQRDLSTIQRDGFASTEDYQIGRDEEGNVSVHMQQYNFGPIFAQPVSDVWVAERLKVLGVDKDMIACGNVASAIKEMMDLGVQNG